MKTIKLRLYRYYATFRGGETLIRYLRHLGCTIGDNVHIPPFKTMDIDLSRPYLIEIGNNVRLNKGLTIMTHDFATVVFKSLFNDFIPSSGKVKIGNNVYFGRNCSVLKNVTIGDNCIIGYGSVVVKDVPPNSVVAGVPAKIICSLDEYYKKRKHIALIEAFALATEIRDKLKRAPQPSDFREEFVYFVSKKNINEYPNIPIRFQLQKAGNIDIYEPWLEHHVPEFSNFDEFIDAANKWQLNVKG